MESPLQRTHQSDWAQLALTQTLVLASWSFVTVAFCAREVITKASGLGGCDRTHFLTLFAPSDVSSFLP